MTEPVVKKAKWSGLGVRLLTGIIVVLVCIAPFYFGGYAWALLVALFSGRMMFEWLRMSDPNGSTLSLSIAIVGLLIALIYAAQGMPFWAIAAMIVATLTGVFEGRNRERMGWIAVGLPYIIVPAVLIILLRGSDVGFATRGFTQLLFIILIVIAADVGAYFGGSTFRGPKLAPKLSPNKTWSGAVSGLVCACMISALIGLLIGLSAVQAVALAIPIVILSVLGDLLESAAKRRLGVKDTGALLPGHGGLLDRLDSLMAAVVGGAILFTILGDWWPIQ